VVIRGGGEATAAPGASTTPSVPILAGALMGAFFAFGGWWDLGKMGEEVRDPRRTLPTALVGGIVLVTIVYAGLSVAFIHVVQGRAPGTDEAFVAALGTELFGEGAAQLLAAAVVVAVAGSLAAVLLGAPRVYLAMARDGVFPGRLFRFNSRRQAAPGATLVQVGLACVLVTLGSFEQILGYFVPAAVFFLGLSAAAILVLPRPRDNIAFRAPLHPLPILVFLVLVVVMVTMFAIGNPVQTLFGAFVVALGVPASWLFVPREPRPDVRAGADQDAPSTTLSNSEDCS
jgi:APA family basic amino acid/polyamine antiporter